MTADEMTERQRDQAWIERERAENLRRANGVKAIDPGGCAPPVYVGERSRMDEAVEVALDAHYAHRRSVGIVVDDLSAMRAAILAAMPVLLGEPVAWLCDAGDGINCDATASVHVRDTYAKVGRKLTALYAPSLGEGHEPA